ncbi:FYN-binding protein 1 [Phycodurus eques]|uniref:FYN-binding protein 1 n=1 Tax=Phycodurus eques TaxID=693459 RepID=UPI002ACEF574|nr:FYN-binding protein 1 [Phycodurus eques]
MRAIASSADKDNSLPKVSAAVFPHMAGPDVVKFQREEAKAPSNPSEPFFPPHPPPNTGVRTSPQCSGVNKIKQTGEMLEKMMLRGPAGTKTLPAAPTLTPLPLRLRSTSNVIPLRKPLPPEGPLPLKPRRPHNIELEQFLRVTQRARPLPAWRTREGSEARQISLPGVTSPSNPPSQFIKSSRQQNQVTSADIDINHDTYDDIASLEDKESRRNSTSQWKDRDESDVYEHIDEDQVRVNWDAGKVAQEQKRENEFRRKFQLQAEEEILHTTRARHDWYGGGKLDLRVHQGEMVEILRVRNNPEGKWLARSLDGKYGYISNKCVDVDYEAVKRKLFQSRRTEASPLPPPPPDPPQQLHMESMNSLSHSQNYSDDFHLSAEDFPPPPPRSEISIDANVEKELRKKFKYEGPLTVLHTVTMDPNAVMKKPGGKDLHVSLGDVLDVIQLTNSKKVLCHNRTSGKYGYVSRKLLIPLEGDVYDDVDYTNDPHDDTAH